MKSQTPGTSTSDAEVTNIDTHGIWVLVKSKEYFLPYEHFPWFKDAKVRDIVDVRLLHGKHLYWPTLDVDLTIDALSNPDKYPLVARPQ